MGLQGIIGRTFRRSAVDSIDGSIELHEFERGGTFDLTPKTTMNDRISVNVITGVVALIIGNTAVPLTVVRSTCIGVQNYHDPLVSKAEQGDLTDAAKRLIESKALRQLQMTKNDVPNELWLRGQATIRKQVQLSRTQRWLAHVTDSKKNETGYLGIDYPAYRVVVQFLGRNNAIDIGPANPSEKFLEAERSHHIQIDHAELEATIVRDRFGIRDFEQIDFAQLMQLVDEQDPTQVAPLPFNFPDSMIDITLSDADVSES